MAANNAATKEKLVTAVVRKGTVFADPVTVKAWDNALNKEVEVVKPGVPKGPGELIQLPAAEVDRLKKLGFLADPDDFEPNSDDVPSSTLKLLDRAEVGFAQKAN